MVSSTVDNDDRFNGSVDDEWTFSNSVSIAHLSHGYHRYPAKFIPQLVKKLIETYTSQEDTIADVFAGCGTTLVESKAHGRKSIGVDINPVAQLITKSKITALAPEQVKQQFDLLINKITDFDSNFKYIEENHPRIDYWFREEEKNKIAFLYQKIYEIVDEKLRNFFLCALSNILKNCSRWLQSSTKPQVDPHKKISDPFVSFPFQVRKMLKKNTEFYNKLEKEGFLDIDCEIKIADARNTGIEDNSIDAIITSPPYVTSYEYADIHQLTGYWFNYISNITTFRKDFIGTFFSNNKNTETPTLIARKIVADLKGIDKKSAGEVAKYFNDMYDVSQEMFRILKPNGIICLVVGNTTMKGVKMLSAQAFAEMFEVIGLKIEKVIKRAIPFKLIPTIRDEKTGKFTTLDNNDKKLVYPEEYIIVAKKTHD